MHIYVCVCVCAHHATIVCAWRLEDTLCVGPGMKAPITRLGSEYLYSLGHLTDL